MLGSVVVARLVGLSGVLWSFPAICRELPAGAPRPRDSCAGAAMVLLLVIDGRAFATTLERLDVPGQRRS